MADASGPTAELPEALAPRVSASLRGFPRYQPHDPEGIRAKLDANELSVGLPRDLRERLDARLAEVSLERYPDASAASLRARFAAELGRADLGADAIVLGNGSDELIAMLVAAFAAPRPGAKTARALYPTPSFVYYRIASAVHGVEPVEVPLRDDFTLDEVAVRWAFSEMRPNVAFFALPNNPTGTLWPLAFVVELARDNPDVIIVSDEAYHAYSGATLASSLGTLPNLVVLRTLSKVGMAGLRVGCLAAHPAVASVLERVRPPYNLGSLHQAAARFFVDEAGDWVRTQAAAVVVERARLAAGLAALPGIRVFASEANLVMIRVGAPGDGRASRMWHHLVAQGVLVRSFDRPGASPVDPLAGCLRITVGTASETDLVLAAIASAPA